MDTPSSRANRLISMSLFFIANIVISSMIIADARADRVDGSYRLGWEAGSTVCQGRELNANL